MAFNNWPYTNFQDLNLNWILDKVKNAISSGTEALTKATEALSKASYAKDTSDDAKDMAQSAQYTAGQANTKADGAVSSAQTANQNAASAQTAAQNAETAAQNAETAATNAVNTANNALQVADGAVGAYKILISGNNTCSHAGSAINANDITAAIADGKIVQAMKTGNADGDITFYEIDSYFIDQSLPAGERTTVYFKRIEDDGSHEMFYERGAITGTNNTMYFAEMSRVHEVAVDDTLTVSGAAADAKATGDRLGEKVDKDGIEQVKSVNIEGMTEAGAGISNNLFPRATLVANGKYVAGIGGITGKAYLLDTPQMDTYIIPVDGVSTYTFTNCRTAIVVSDLEYTPVGELLSYVTRIDSVGGKYILFSFNPTTYPVNSYSITKPVTKYTIPSNWIIPDEGDLKKPIDSANGTGTLNIVGRSALKDGELITFKGFFDTFSEFSLNFYGSTITNYIKVDATNITIKNNTSTPTPQAHGLTIQNDVELMAQFIDGTMKITLYSNGELWTSTVQWYQTNGTVTQPQVVPNGMSFTNAILNVVYDAVTRGIWYFGDSYTGITSPDRWVYYLKEDGFSVNALINGSAGSTSSGANTALNTLLKYGTPKFAVMATGMNDGSDTDGNPPNLWINSRDAFITACQNNDIEPIFATIPTVPTVNNEAKNAWVKASGYRYIDFAKAVGADGTGTWYSGMLSGDNVHPTAKGAKALYTQVLIDLPEITISN